MQLYFAFVVSCWRNCGQLYRYDSIWIYMHTHMRPWLHYYYCWRVHLHCRYLHSNYCPSVRCQPMQLYFAFVVSCRWNCGQLYSYDNIWIYMLTHMRPWLHCYYCRSEHLHCRYLHSNYCPSVRYRPIVLYLFVFCRYLRSKYSPSVRCRPMQLYFAFVVSCRRNCGHLRS